MNPYSHLDLTPEERDFIDCPSPPVPGNPPPSEPAKPFSPEDFQQYQLYFQQCLSQNKINQEQFNHLMGLFLDGQNLHEILSDLNLSQGFEVFKRAQERLQQEIALQKSVLQDWVNTGNKELGTLQGRLILIQQDLEMKKEKHRSCQSRIDKYQAYDNPKLNAELAQAQTEMDQQNSVFLEILEKVQAKEKIIKSWEHQLVQM